MTAFDADSFDDIQALDAEHGMQTYGRLPVAFVRGEGVKLWDSEGKEYLDFLGGLAVTALGHAHPAVADALADQARTLLHVSNLYFNEWQPQVAARLDALHGGGGKVFFANSGAEANECAIKLARRYGQANGGPDRFHVLSAWGSFHGRTLTTLAATGQPQKQETFQPLPVGFRQVVFADLDALGGGDGRAGVRGDARADPGRGRCPAVAARLPRGRARAVRRARGAARSSTRCRPASVAPASGSATSTPTACGPTSSPWPRRSATACPSARAGPAPTWPRRSGPATTPPPTAASRSPRAPRARCST